MCHVLLHHSLPFLPLLKILIPRRGKWGGGGGESVKIPRDRLTMCRWIKKKLLLCFDLNKRLPVHSSLAQNRTKMGSITGHIIG